MNLRRKPTSAEDFIASAGLSYRADVSEKVQQLEQQLAEQQEREQALVSEIGQLRSRFLDDSEREQLQQQLEELRDRLEQSQGAIDYPVEKMRRNEDQPRQTFKAEVDAMAKSLLTEGQLDPVMIFQDGTLFDGECRWRAAVQIGWEMLKTVIVPRPDDKTLRRRAYLTSLHRQGLNPLDRAEALVAIVCDHVADVSAEEVPKIVSRVLKRIKRKDLKIDSELHKQPIKEQQAAIAAIQQQGVEISATEADVLLVLLGLQEHPASLERNIFTALNLAQDLKYAVRQQQLGCSQAILLNALAADRLGITEQRATTLRKKGIKLVVERNLTDAQTRVWVTEQKQALNISDQQRPERDVKVDRVLKSVKDLDVSVMAIEQRQELKKLLESVLQQLNDAAEPL